MWPFYWKACKYIAHWINVIDVTGCVKLLLEYGANPNSVRDDRFSPLHVAAIQGHTV